MTTIENIQAYTLQNIDEFFRGHVNEWIVQMTTYIERTTNRSFSTDDEVSIRKYDGNGAQVLLVDDFVELEEVTIDGALVAVTVYPANTMPKYKLIADGRFTKGRQNVAVTARWGYGIVPNDLVFACTVLVAGLVQNHTKSDGAMASESIGNYSVSYATDAQRDDFNRAKEILAMYRVHHL